MTGVGALPTRRRPLGERLAPALTPVLVVAAAVAGLALAARFEAPLVAAASLAAIGATVAVRRPAVGLAGALAWLAWDPAFVFGADSALAAPEPYKLVLIGLAAPAVLERGLRPVGLLPVGAYVLLGAITALAGTQADNLTITQSASTLVSLGAVWFVFATRWRPEDAWVLVGVALMPVLSLALGVVLHLSGTLSGDLAPYGRLVGAQGPAFLGAEAAWGVAAAAFLAWTRPGLLPFGLIAVDALIAAASGTRGSLIAIAIVLAPLAVRGVRAGLRHPGRAGPLVLVVPLVLLVGLVAFTVPRVQARNDQISYVNGVGLAQDPTSGRAAAWSQFFAIALEEPVFGHGLGSGPITKIEQQGFRAQHNEYLRLFLEGGVLGSLVVGGAILAALVDRLRAARQTRPIAAASMLAFAIYALTDNALSSTAAAYPFAFAVGVGAVAVAVERRSPETP